MIGIEYDLAIEFCREILGWEEAAPHHDGEFSIREHAHHSGGRFYHSSLDACMEAARNYGARIDRPLRITLLPCGHASVQFDGWADVQIAGKGEQADLRLALITACLEAHGKLKAARPRDPVRQI